MKLLTQLLSARKDGETEREFAKRRIVGQVFQMCLPKVRVSAKSSRFVGNKLILPRKFCKSSVARIVSKSQKSFGIWNSHRQLSKSCANEKRLMLSANSSFAKREIRLPSIIKSCEKRRNLSASLTAQMCAAVSSRTTRAAHICNANASSWRGPFHSRRDYGTFRRKFNSALLTRDARKLQNRNLSSRKLHRRAKEKGELKTRLRLRLDTLSISVSVNSLLARIIK